MEGIFKNLKDLFSFLWVKPKTPEEKVIKRYDIVIAICVLFMAVYIAVFLYNLKRTATDNKTFINSVDVAIVKTHPEYNTLIKHTTNVVPSVVPTNTSHIEFVEGEIVGIKYFGIFGLVTSKIFGTDGYRYNVMWKDNNHGLCEHEFYTWQLYRPEDNTVPLSALQN